MSYLRLLRIANLPTVWANTLTAYWLAVAVAGVAFSVSWILPGLLAVGSCFYLGGMVLNDWFDLELDRLERPERPLPSGRISVTMAGGLGFFLLVAGLATVIVTAWPNPVAMAMGAAIPVAVLLYNAWLKHTPAASLGMGACRALNILFVLCCTAAEETAWNTSAFFLLTLYPLGVFAYTSLVTLIAAQEVRRPWLQPVVGWMLLAMIPVDAVICLFVCGWRPALVVLALLPLPLLLRRSIPMS